MDEKKEFVNKGPPIGVRHIQTILMFLLISIAYSMRVNLSVGIVAMTDSTTTNNPDVPTYHWSNKSVILSSFFWGYISLQILAGELGKRFGTKLILTIAMIVNSIPCLLTPIVANNFGSNGLIACRVLQGAAQGFFFPSVHTILGKWAPPDERSRISNFIFSGVAFGTIISMPATGLISASWAGWPTSFYVFGSLGLLWCVIWLTWGASSPAVHPRITPEERSYIENSLGNANTTQPPKTPWKAIFTSKAALALFIAHCGQNWGYSALLTEIPNYLNEVMKFNMKSNAWLSAAPYLTYFLLSFGFGPAADYLIVSGKLSRTAVRKLFQSIGTIIPGLALAALGYIPQDQPELSVFFLTLAVGINGATNCGFLVNPVDLTPQFSGVLLGISNGCSNVFSIISPLVVQAIVTDETDPNLWRIVFLIAAVVYIVSDIVFVLIGSGERQPWDPTDEETKDCKKVAVR